MKASLSSNSIHKLQCVNTVNLVLIDIDRAYDVLEWNVILPTLISMNFPPVWIKWIKVCIFFS